jgi:hypothetical protein
MPSTVFLFSNKISKTFILLLDVLSDDLVHLYVQDLHWALYTDHCYPCLAKYTHILEVFRENQPDFCRGLFRRFFKLEFSSVLRSPLAVSANNIPVELSSLVTLSD